MAIDTAIKRASMGNEFMPVFMPDPDNAWNMADRSIFNWLYAGLDYTPIPPAVGGDQKVFNMDRWNCVVRDTQFVLRRVARIVHFMDIRGIHAR